MPYPEWNESASDKELISEFYGELLERYAELKDDIEYNQGLLHCDMGDLKALAEAMCEDRKLDELKECLTWLNSFFCRSRNELLNAINVSFLECFNFNRGITAQELQEVMPKELYRGYLEMMEYMENLAKEAKEYLTRSGNAET